MKLKLTKSNFKALSNISADIAQVLFGAVIAAVVVLPLDPDKLKVVTLELIFSLGFWYLSLFYAEKGKL